MVVRPGVAAVIFDGDRVSDFEEKPQIGEGWINGGFLVLEPGFFQYLAGDGASLEANGLEAAARDGQLMAFRHERFWQCMDTLRELRILQAMWADQRAPWQLWK